MFSCFAKIYALMQKIRCGPEFDTFAIKLFVKIITAILVFIFYAAQSEAQIDSVKQKSDTLQGRSFLLQKVDRNGETLPEVEIKEVTVYAHPQFPKKSEFRKYERLVANLKRVYPY